MKNELNGWIPVSERLPDMFERVLVIGCIHGYNSAISEPKIGMVDFESIEISEFAFSNYNEEWFTNITHWQPLPKLPEVQDANAQ